MSEPEVDVRTATPTGRGLSYAFARRSGVLVKADGGGCPVCTHRIPLRLEARLEVQRVFGPAVTFMPVDDETFEVELRDQYRSLAGQSSEFTVASGDDLAALAQSAVSVDDLLDQRDDSPVIRLINALLLEAVRDGASDIHIETEERRVIVRFRVDGVLRDKIEPDRALAPLLVSRIKVMAQLDIAEKRLPHDGRVKLRVGGLDLDVRVSTVPTQYGERVVMRLLDRDATRLDLAGLGMQARDLAVFERMIARPHGIILVTGPTGAGKTTSLYAALTRLNDRRRNIMTVEDPIEYELEGVGQMQVNSRIDLTFARGLRSILRQDPDVIMVGEIRDHETAEVAVRASLTGHLVLSTLHTNSAIGSVTRLTDMGVERYLLAPMLVGLIAQRLVRRLCPHCREPSEVTPADAEALGGTLAVGARVWRARGCPDCRHEGYKGRLGLYEVVEVDERLQALIHDGASELELGRAARLSGPGLMDDARAKLLAGLTTVDEVFRVVQDET